VPTTKKYDDKKKETHKISDAPDDSLKVSIELQNKLAREARAERRKGHGCQVVKIVNDFVAGVHASSSSSQSSSLSPGQVSRRTPRTKMTKKELERKQYETDAFLKICRPAFEHAKKVSDTNLPDTSLEEIETRAFAALKLADRIAKKNRKRSTAVSKKIVPRDVAERLGLA
jgi:hypothetical protein